MLFHKREKWYIVHGVVNGREFSSNTRYFERYDAVEDTMERLFSGKEIQHRIRHDKHNIEYYMDDYNRFSVLRMKRMKKISNN